MKIPTKVPELGYYHHYKHDPAKGVQDYAYEVLGIFFHTEDRPEYPEDYCFVEYRPLYESAAVYQASLTLKIPCKDGRPIEMWMGNAIVGGQEVPRFTLITDLGTILALNLVRDRMYPQD